MTKKLVNYFDVLLSLSCSLMNQKQIKCPRHWHQHTKMMLDSFQQHLLRELIPRSINLEQQANQLFQAPFVVVSHGTESDPILNYGNQTALDLWQMEIEQFCQTPSRKTAEPLHRDERSKLLQRTSEQGYVDDYRGIRISSQGKRFLIDRAIVWNLIDSSGNYAGQAATFDQWTYLKD